MIDFSGKHAFVTGAASGIGRATAVELARRGVNLSLADRDLSGLEETARLLAASGVRVGCFGLDVSDPAAVASVIGEVEEAAGGSPDFLVNGAGAFFGGPIEALTDEALRQCFAINVFGVFHTCRALLPGMIRRGGGTIVNISSLHAQNGQPNAAVYAAAKGAVMGFTKSLAREKASGGIRANVVAPGPIDTPFWRGAMIKGDYDAVVAERVKTIPLGRLGQADDIANVIVFLLSSASAYMTGQVVTVGGGEIMP